MRPHDESAQYDPKARQLICRGEWDLVNLPHLKNSLKKIKWPTSGDIIINGEGIDKMDSAGAWLINEWQKKLGTKGLNLHLENFSETHTALLALVKGNIEEEAPLPEIKQLGPLASLGKYSLEQFNELQQYLAFIGQLTFDLLRTLANPARLRLASTAAVIYRAGYQALPIIAVLSFMIGVVIAYQMGLQLRYYGANIYIVDFLGLAVLREFAPLLTAILMAGRTGSSFTAQLGMMKINQEIDALNTMGVTPGELLLLPRIAGLFIALPLLCVWADIWGVFGGMIMSSSMLNITWHDFLHRFPQTVRLKGLLVGLGKAPIFALIIASVGCFQGMQVKGSADSVGTNTTRSVVVSIFFIIVADAAFSIIFSKLQL